MKIDGSAMSFAAGSLLRSAANIQTGAKPLDDSMTGLVEAGVQGKAAAKLIKVQDEVLGTLLDLKA